MKDSAVHIESHSDLVSLQDAMQSWREDMGRLLNAVDSYLLDRLKAYKELEDSLKEELKKADEELKKADEVLRQAQEELNSANSEYSSCRASQHWVEDEDGHEELRPSCSSEAAAAARAQNHYDSCKAEYDRCLKYRDECNARYEKCKKINAECVEAQQQYKANSILYTGAEEWIRSITEDHTKKGCDKIGQILEILGRYHNRKLTATASDSTGVDTTAMSKSERFSAATERIKEMEAQMPSKAERFNAAKQKLESELIPSSRTQAPNAIAICPGCERPIPICICSRNYERTH